MNNSDNNNICCILNLAPHYREPIFKLMDKELKCDFYFGDKVDMPIKLMDVTELKGYKKTVENKKIIFNKYTWQKGVVKLVFKKYKYFILTGNPSCLSNWFIVLFALFLNKKVYLWMHGLKSEVNLSWKAKLLIYPFYHIADKFLLYGEYSKNILIKKGFNEKKMFCIYNSLDYDQQLLSREQLAKSRIFYNYFKNDYPILIFLGRIQHSKKINLILEAMTILKKQNFMCNLVIVGEDKEGVCLDKVICKNNLTENVWLYGSSYQEKEIAELFYNSSLCVSPGNIGLVAMHSLVYGIPAITHDNFENQMPEFEAIIPGKTGDFFKEDNVSDLSEKIKKWICLDPQTREIVSKNCRNIIDEKYNPHYQINLLKKITNC